MQCIGKQKQMLQLAVEDKVNWINEEYLLINFYYESRLKLESSLGTKKALFLIDLYLDCLRAFNIIIEGSICEECLPRDQC